MKRSTEQVLRDEIAAALKAVEAGEARVDRANEAWTMANMERIERADELAATRARLFRANAALAAFTPPAEELELFPAEELVKVPAAQLDELVEGEVS
jgi:hypothetical protein